MDNFNQNEINGYMPQQEVDNGSYSQSIYNQPNNQIPPQQMYNQYNHPIQGNDGRGAGWIGFVRVILWLYFSAILIGTIIVACISLEESPLLCLSILFGGILMAFASVAMGMIFLDLCNNVRKMTTNTDKILQMLSRK